MNMDHSIEIHTRCVNGLFRICCNRSQTKKERDARKKPITYASLKDDLFLMFGINVSVFDDKFSQTVCSKCHFKIKTIKRNQSQVMLSNIKMLIANTAHLWQAFNHISTTEECSICLRYESFSSGSKNMSKSNLSHDASGSLIPIEAITASASCTLSDLNNENVGRSQFEETGLDDTLMLVVTTTEIEDSFTTQPSISRNANLPLTKFKTTFKKNLNTVVYRHYTRRMPRNVEIKARVEHLEELKVKAKQLAGEEGIHILQEDTFFKVPNGRLKLRHLKKEKKSILIQYSRSDQTGPKLSDFQLVEVEDGEGLKSALTCSLGVMGVVKKDRLLVMCGQTRIHLDEVEGLGQFMELEVKLRDEQTTEDGQKIAEDIMKDLDIKEADLIECAYMDLILKGEV